MAATDELIEELQKRLHKSGPLPPWKNVAAALAMARDSSLTASKACNDAGVPKGGARSRVAEYHKRIVRDGLLAAFSPPPPPPTELSPPPVSVRQYHDSLRQYHDDWVKEHYPQLQAPCCPTCGNGCTLVRFLCQFDYCCDECQHTPLPASVYWVGHSCSEDCQEKYGAAYTLCHSCTPATAQLDWNSATAQIEWGEFKRTPGERTAYFDTLTLENDTAAFDGTPDGYNIDSELRTAKALLLPCHRPEVHRGALFHAPHNYFSRLLVSKDWVASKAPNIWSLTVKPLRVSDDGKHAIRSLEAFTKVDESERDLDVDDWTYECFIEEVTYDFPALDSKDIFARQRHMDRMRRREEACIRELDGDAAIDHRERKARMACERQYRDVKEGSF